MEKLFQSLSWLHTKSWAKVCVAVFAFLALTSIFFLPKLQFSFEMNDFFPNHEDSAVLYEQFEQEVGSLQYNFMIAVAPKNNTWDYKFTNQLKNLSESLSEQLDTYASFSILDVAGTNANSAIGLMSRNTAAQRFVNQKEKWVDDPRFASFLLSKDGNATIFYLQQNKPMQIAEAIQAAKLIEQKKEEFGELSITYMGTGYLHQQVEKIQKQEIILFACVSLLVTFLFSFFLFQRNMRLVLISLVSLALMFILLGGFLVVLRVPLSLLMSLLPIIMLIVGTADIVHFFTKYSKEKQQQDNKIAIQNTLNDVGVATFLTSITSAFAFIALSFNSIPAIRFFGFSAALAVLLAYLVLIFFTVPLLALSFGDAKNTSTKKANQFFHGIYHFGKRNSRLISQLGAVFFVVAMVGISLTKFDFDPLSVLPRNKKVIQDFYYFEKQLDGIRPIEVYVSSDSETVASYSAIQKIDEVETYMRDSLDLGICLSPTYPYKLYHSFQKRNADQFVLPESEEKWSQINKAIRRFQSSKNPGGNHYNSDSTLTRIISSMQSVGTEKSSITLHQLKNKLAEVNQESSIQFRLQGFADLIEQNVTFIRNNMLKGLAISLVLVSLLIAIVFKEPWYMLAAFLPNVIPLFFTAALIGFWGINFDSTLTMIFAVLFGLVVDDSIHFLSKYRIERRKQKSVEEAIKVTLEESGKAIVYTSILIFAGLLISLSSAFYPTRLVGLLMGATILFALLCDLFLLPFIIRKLDK